jgi:excisionase family DNA binding protein
MPRSARKPPPNARSLDPVRADPDEQGDLEALRELVGELVRAHARGSARGELVGGPRGRHAPVPGSVVRLLDRATQAMARGDAVAVVPLRRELTSQQAADLLNVSRQYLVRLVDQGRIPSVRTGKHRRLLLTDVLAFRRKRDKARKASLRALTRATEAAGGYEAESQ